MKNTKKKQYLKYLLIENDLSAASSATELSTTIGTFGMSSVPSASIPSRLSLTDNVLSLAVSMENSQTVSLSSESSNSNDANHVQEISTITSTRASHHFNIDEYYLTNDENITITGKECTNMQ